MSTSKTLKSKLALMAATAAATAYLAIPSEGKAYDVTYYADTIPDSVRVKEREAIVSNCSFPYQFDFFYEIPKNEEGFAGNLELRRDRNKTELEIRIIHPKADKLFNFSEIRERDSIFYYEREYDYPQNKVLYENKVGFSKTDRSSTVVSLTEQALNCEIPHPSFVFKGSSKSPKKYKLETTSSVENGYDLILTGSIEDNSRRVPQVKASFKKIHGKLVPIEIEVFYRLNWLNTGLFGTIHVTPNIKGVLTKKK